MESEEGEARGASLVAGLDARDPLALAFAVRACAETLRTADADPGVLAELVAKIAALAASTDARVRQSVAEITPYLPERAFEALHPALAADASGYVRDAVERAAKKRATLRRAAAKEEEHDVRVDGWYRAIGVKGARAIAARIASHETEYFVRRMAHEAASSFMGFDDAAKRLRDALDAPAIDRDAARALLARMEERFAFFRHVLETGRAHARPLEPEMRRERLFDLLADEAAIVKTRFPDRAPRIDVDLSDVDRAIEADVDAGYVRQAIGNVLKNAVESYDALGPGAPIAVRVRASVTGSGAEVAIAIEDRGAGMHPSSVEKAFVPFGSSKPGGTGFGLYVARQVARAVHGGELAIASALGEGTTVTMVLPMRQETPKKARGRASKREL